MPRPLLDRFVIAASALPLLLGCSSTPDDGTSAPPPPGPATLTRVDLGTLSLADASFFDVPTRTLGFSVVAEAPSVDEVIGIERMKPPDGEVIVAYAMEGHDVQRFGRFGWVTASDPQSDAAAAYPVQIGQWRLRLGDDDGSIQSAAARLYLRRTADGAFHGGVVDINLITAPGRDTDYLDDLLHKSFPFAGLDLGTITHLEIQGGPAAVHSDAELRALFRSTAGITGLPAVNLFVLDELQLDAATHTLGGSSGGSPGCATEHGTSQSGVALVATGDLDNDAHVLRHELGHFAGLFHTTELGGGDTDSLSDTPSCDTSTITTDPGSCPDASNLMFPTGFGDEMTPAQARVIQGSSIYRGRADDAAAPEP